MVITKAGADGIINQLKEGILTILAEERIDAIGIGFGRPVDRDTGIISQSSISMEGFKAYDFSNLGSSPWCMCSLMKKAQKIIDTFLIHILTI